MSKNNIKAVKKTLKRIAFEGDMKFRWKVFKNIDIIYVQYAYKLGKVKDNTELILPLDAISTGRYSKSMVKYNVVRHLSAWINKFYENYKDKMSKID